MRRRRQRSKTFAYIYRLPGAGRASPPRTYKVGTWPTLKEASARKIVQGLVTDVARGQDPQRERREQRAKRSQALKHLLAVDGPYERFLRARHLVNTTTALSSLRRTLVPLFDAEPATLTRAHYVRAIEAWKLAGKPGAFTDARKFCLGFCEWCVAQGYAASNPLSGWRSGPHPC